MKKKKKSNNEIKIQLIIIFILIGILFGLMYIYFNRMNFRPREENVIKETSAKDVDEGVVVNDKEINSKKITFDGNTITYKMDDPNWSDFI